MDDELLRALGRAQRNPAAMQTTAPHDSASPAPVRDDLTRPLDSAERALVLDALFAEIDVQRDPGPAETPVVPAPEIRSRSRARLAGVIGAVVAIAAALVLWLGRPPASYAELPSYAMTELQGGVSAVRSDPSALDRVLDMRPGGKIQLVMTPAVPSKEPLVVDLVAQQEGAEDRMVRVTPEVSPSGAVRLTGVLTDLIALEPGPWTITVVVSPAAAAPDDPEAALSAAAGRRASFRIELRAAS